jgi:hypothetical protein
MGAGPAWVELSLTSPYFASALVPSAEGTVKTPPESPLMGQSRQNDPFECRTRSLSRR